MSMRVLVVEDEAPIRDMLSFMLEQKGFESIEAVDFSDALQKVKEPYPDLILLDWMLPGGSGLQFIKLMKQEELTRNIPIVMLTARGEEEDKVKGLEVGAIISPSHSLPRNSSPGSKRSCGGRHPQQPKISSTFRGLFWIQFPTEYPLTHIL
jgi:CheY-like chemotaxis protein